MKRMWAGDLEEIANIEQNIKKNINKHEKELPVGRLSISIYPLIDYYY